MRTDELDFDDGLVAFKVKGGKVTLTFNPTDAAFFGKVYNAFDHLNQKQKQYDQESKDLQGKEAFEFISKIGNEMRATIDSVFNPVSDVESVCDALIGDMNPYSYGDGLPVWTNFLLAVMDKADTSIKQQKELTNPRVQKYTSKYHK